MARRYTVNDFFCAGESHLLMKLRKINLWVAVLSILMISSGLKIINEGGVRKSIFVELGEYAVVVGGVFIVLGLYVLYLAFAPERD